MRREDIADWEQRSEYEKWERQVAGHKELDRRVPPVWEAAEEGRCSFKRPAESSGRIMRCSNDARWLKLHKDPGKMILPLGQYCNEHAAEVGLPAGLRSGG